MLEVGKYCRILKYELSCVKGQRKSLNHKNVKFAAPHIERRYRQNVFLELTRKLLM